MKQKKIEKKKLEDKKILFVIPAYNESENIEKVLQELKNKVPFADVLVINDCSKDNTGEIVERKITRGRHSGRRRGEKGAAEKPGALAAQGLPAGRHWVDTGKAESNSLPLYFAGQPCRLC